MQRVCLRIIGLAALALASCADMVPLKQGAEQVRVVDPYDARPCQVLGNTRVSVLGKLGPIERDAFKVEAELSRLARNSALEMGGNGVSPAGPVVNGEREFKVLRCQ